MTDRTGTLAYIAPFIAFLALMAAERTLGLPPQIALPVRVAVVVALLFTVSRAVIEWPPSRFWASVGVGALVFLIWVGPDILFGYRGHWLFTNSLLGKPESSVPADVRADWLFTALRAFSCTLVVPVFEELFWRGWMLRWLANSNFRKFPYSNYTPLAFWLTAVLFASEHGPWWEVGLITGIIYNWWVMRTRNLADVMVAHAVTNGILSAYILYTGKWEYWL